MQSRSPNTTGPKRSLQPDLRSPVQGDRWRGCTDGNRGGRSSTAASAPAALAGVGNQLDPEVLVGRHVAVECYVHGQGAGRVVDRVDAEAAAEGVLARASDELLGRVAADHLVVESKCRPRAGSRPCS